MEEKRDTDNTYANTIENIGVHISEVESGRKGYYCQGCGREMIAKKGDILMHHFAHDPKDVQNKGKCTYSDETYRHKLAKEILQMIKKIKVPTLYKYPPPGVEGKPNKLRDAEFIEAGSVRMELAFYEDEHGIIQYGSGLDVESDSSKFLLIKPDVTFFDENDNPILFIELIATHKITDEKIVKIKKLAVNTVRVSIPKGAPDEIQDTFFITTRTQWVYNNEQEKATYLRTSKGDSEDVPPLTDLQKRLLAANESYECRAFQIRDLIRGLNKCLESQPYIDFEHFLREELQRVEGNTESHRERLRGLQKQHKARIEEEFELEKRDVKQQEAAVTEESRALDEKRRDLEERYYRKKEELEREQKEYRSEYQDEIDRITGEFERLGTDADKFRRRSEEVRGEEKTLEQRIRDEISRIEEETRATADAIAEIEGRRGAFSKKYQGTEADLRAAFEGKRDRIEQDGSRTLAAFRADFERRRKLAAYSIETANSSGFSRVSRELRSIREARQHLLDISQETINLRRMRKFKEIFDTGAYKS